MKKILTIFLTMILTFSLTACGTKNNETENPGGNENNNIENNNGGSESNKDDESFDISNWGREDMVTTVDGETIDDYYIRLPRYTGSNYWYSKISEQLDDTVVLISGQYIDMPGVEKTADIFAAYKEYTLQSLEALYGIQSSNFNITIDSSKPVTIGDYDMYMHTGIITYDYRNSHNNTTKRTHQYVAYATKLKDSGNCAYWMVYDFSTDQSKGELIKEHAYHMAQSFREEK